MLNVGNQWWRTEILAELCSDEDPRVTSAREAFLKGDVSGVLALLDERITALMAQLPGWKPTEIDTQFPFSVEDVIRALDYPAVQQQTARPRNIIERPTPLAATILTAIGAKPRQVPR